jgi:hypothetical protein
MDVDAMRNALLEFRTFADIRALELKDSQSVLEEMSKLYKSFNNSERPLANDVIAEWVVSDDENLRFDALALIDEFHIGEAAVALQQLLRRLAVMRTPGAPYEIEKVVRTIKLLQEEI